MALIQIFSLTGQELEYKKDSLTLKKENNSLSSDFKVPHSQFPFLVIENDVTKSVLGPSDITSIRKNKIVPVVILENGVRYYGELQQLTVLSKFRKCNLKYGSDIIPIVNKKIAEFMPSVSVIPGETSPIPFTEESTEIIAGNEYWETFPVSMIGQIYPDVKFNFPTMYWKNKFGVDLESTDPWYLYQNQINKFFTDTEDITTFVENTIDIDGTTITIKNRNVPSPQVFLLSPLFYVFNHINYKISGNFIENEFIKKLLLLSVKDNLTKSYILIQSSSNINLSPLVSQGYDGYYSLFVLNTTHAGRYIFNKNFFEEQFFTTNVYTIIKRFQIVYKGLAYGFYQHNPGDSDTTYTEEFVIDVATEDVGEPMYISYLSAENELPTSYELNYYITSFEKDFNQMHPTIELGRYVPEWTVGNYLNYIKNQFNLDITIDDFKKEITLNLNENITANEEPAIISQSLAMKSYDIAANSSFVLKYENDEDEAIFITQNEIVTYDGTKDDFTKIIDSKFKLVPSNGYTSELSEELVEKTGVGLMIYEPINAPFTTKITSDGYHLNISGEKGIYETFFRRWIKFLLNASNCEVTGYFTETEISKINKAKAVYINNQRFRIIDIQTTEAANNFQEVKMRLLSVNY